MPPQQSHGLLDRFDQLFGFSAHDPTDDKAYDPARGCLDRRGQFQALNRARLSRSQSLARFGTMSERIRSNHPRPHKNLAARYRA